MIETVVIDEDGAIVLPEAMCKEFGLNAGDRLSVASEKHFDPIRSTGINCPPDCGLSAATSLLSASSRASNSSCCLSAGDGS